MQTHRIKVLGQAGQDSGSRRSWPETKKKRKTAKKQQKSSQQQRQATKATTELPGEPDIRAS
ncbi:GD17807 [Drosophila simulans]|uniref:GD17807 n=1 Tax=Drosophila simulans TaxID=7240 RepID=B4Q6E6_DROSI|nr:GD17807 [Drosophila simulans]